MQKPEMLQRFTAEAPAEWLRMMASYVTRSGSWKDNPINVRVSLRSGHEATGAVLSITHRQGDATVLLAAGEGTSQVLSAFHLADVVLLRVEATAALADILKAVSENAFDPSKAPSRMELRREVGAISDELKKAGLNLSLEVAWDDLGEAPEALAGFSRLARELGALVRDLAGQADGKAALEKISSLRLRPGKAAPVDAKREGGLVTVTADAQQLLLGDLAAKLKTAIEAAL